MDICSLEKTLKPEPLSKSMSLGLTLRIKNEGLVNEDLLWGL